MWHWTFFPLPLTLLFLSPAAPAVCPDSLQHKEQKVETKEQHLHRQQEKNNFVNKILIYIFLSKFCFGHCRRKTTHQAENVCAPQTKMIVLNQIGFLNSSSENHRRKPSSGYDKRAGPLECILDFKKLYSFTLSSLLWDF